MNGYKLAECQEEKDLGVLVSNNLKVGPQCNQAFQKANRMLGLLKRMIDNKTSHIMLSLYKSQLFVLTSNIVYPRGQHTTLKIKIHCNAFSTDLPDSFQECRNSHTWNA